MPPIAASPRRPAVALALLAALTVAPRVADAQRTPKRSARPAAAATPDAARLQRDIAWLADDAREGRGTGTAGNDSAAAWIARRMAELRLQPIVTDGETEASCPRPALRTALAPTRGPRAVDAADYPRCAGYLQRFVARPPVRGHAGTPTRRELPTQNVVAFLPGTDPALRGQVVVLGAHYDHLGRDASSATDPKAGDAIRNGADDNASGTATVLELARLLAAAPPKRSVAFVLFSGEELGLLGSNWFVNHAPVPLDSVVAMLNFDMVGRLTNDKLLVYGTATAQELPALLDSANAAGPKLQVKGIGDGFGPSDHASFYEKNLPVLHFFTDQHADYHAAGDDADRINVPGTARVADLALRVTRAVADRPARLTFTKAPTTARMGGSESRQGPQVYLGSVPDMAGDDVRGLRLQRVTEGSPADRGGLKAGDVVVELDGKPVTDLYTYTDALYSHAPGDEVTVVVLRAPAAGGEPQRVSVRVTLGRRGG